LSAGLALPHGMFKGVTQIMRSAEPATTSQPSRGQASQLPAHPDRSAIEAAAQPAISSPRTLNGDITKRALADMLPEVHSSQQGRLSLTRELGLKINRIVIDPGHGGFDTGAKGPHGLQEKDLCLDVALRLGKMIEDNITGAQVVYTRKDDSYVPLEERTAIANDADADLFISIHANSSDISEVRGVETYYLSLAASKEAKELAIRENALTQSSLHDLPDLVKKITRNEKIAESKLLAAEIQGTLSERLQVVSHREKNRGVKQAPFIVLTGANMPAVLSEISFVSNANDESLLLGALSASASLTACIVELQPTWMACTACRQIGRSCLPRIAVAPCRDFHKRWPEMGEILFDFNTCFRSHFVRSAIYPFIFYNFSCT